MYARRTSRGGFTLVEILVATALTLLMMGLVVTVFALVSDNVTGSRATVEMSEQLRTVADQLQMDLEGVTVITKPPRDPANDEGYLEYIEGVIGPVMPAQSICFTNTDTLDNPTLLPGRDGNVDPDTTVGDIDDVLMFTTRALSKPFLGRSPAGPISSDVAEVCYFLRGRTLYRRALLVMPNADALIDRQIAEGEVPDMLPLGPGQEDDPRLSPGFYAKYDISVRQEGGYFDRRPQVLGLTTTTPERLVPNTLGDLTKRENRYGHQPYAFPHDARFWGRLGLPTLGECSHWVDVPTDGADVDGDGINDDDDGDLDETDPDGKYYTWPFPWQRYPTAHPSTPHFDAVDAWYYWSSAAPVSPVTAECGLTNTDPNYPVPTRHFQILVVPQINRANSGSPGIPLVLNGSNTDNDPPAYTAGSPSSRGVFVELTEGQRATWFPPRPGSRPFDAWQNPHPWRSAGGALELAADTGGVVAYSSHVVGSGGQNYTTQNDRMNEDVILNNVLSFDVKAWDPNAPVFAASTTTGTTTQTTVVLPGDVNYLPNYLRPFVDGVGASPVAFGAYVDLNYMCRATVDTLPSPDALDKYTVIVGDALRPHFGGPGEVKSLVHGLLRVPFVAGTWGTPLVPADRLAAVYDTWSNHYEHDGVDQDGDATPAVNNVYGNVDEGRNGLDDDGDGPVDDEDEWEAPPPYPHPLRGIQIKIRVFEPTSRQIREVTIVEEFADR